MTTRYGAFPVVALGSTLMLEQGERLSLAQAFESDGLPGPLSALSDALDLATALAIVTPAYAIGGPVMLMAARTYQADLASVAAARRTVTAPAS